MADLTPTEQRVAELVAAGMRNKQVAAELDLALKTVETHLTRVYRKLGIHSRAELAAARRGGTLRPNSPLRTPAFPHINEDEDRLKLGEGSR